MIRARKYTIVTQLHEKLNKDIINYFDETVSTYSVAFRRTFHKLNNNSKINISKLNTGIQKEYKVTKRTANSIIRDAKGRISALKELRETELKSITARIKYLKDTVIPEMEQQLASNILKLI